MTERTSRTARLFVGSSFADMATERDVLVRQVFPHLRSKCSSYSVGVEDVDLNWGVAANQENDLRVLEIVGSELNQMSAMVVILGERFPGILLALQVYVALASPTTKLFLFHRHQDFTARLSTPDSRTLYYDASNDLIRQQQLLLTRLKERGVEPIEYDSLESFGSLAVQVLGEYLKTEFCDKTAVFISYSRRDLPISIALKNALELRRFDVWLDVLGIAAGEEWVTRLTTAVKDSDVVLLLLSPDSSQSRYCIKEIKFALDEMKPILAIKLGDFAVPPEVRFLLGDIQHVVLPANQNMESILDAVDRGLRALARKGGD